MTEAKRAHEEKRFSSMNIEQLRTRLLKMKNIEKMRNFSTVAQEYADRTGQVEYLYLMNAARGKLLVMVN